MPEDLQKNLLTKSDEVLAENQAKKIWNESKKVWLVSAPATFTRFTTFGVCLITQAFVGHIGALELAAFTLVQSVILRFSSGLLLGLGSGLETLCGQAYGAKQFNMLGIYLQRSWILLTMATIGILPLLIFATPVLIILGQEETIAKEAGKVALWMIPVIYSTILSFTCQMFLQSQSKNVIIAYLSVVSLSIHVLLSWLLTVKYKYGVPGAMISTNLAFWIPSVGQLLFITTGSCRQTWRGLSSQSFKDILPIIKLSLSSGAMICLEQWYSSIFMLLTGYLKNAEIALNALSICLNISGWQVMISDGFLSAASVRVGNELGRGSVTATKFSIWVTVLTSFSFGVIFFIIFLFFTEQMAYMFTVSDMVVKAVDDLSPVLSFSILLNSVQPVLSGVIVGAGLQSIVAYINIGCFYLFGIPIAFLLGYVIEWQVQGVWIGMLLGTLVQAIILLAIILKIDWNKQVLAAQQRLNAWLIQ